MRKHGKELNQKNACLGQFFEGAKNIAIVGIGGVKATEYLELFKGWFPDVNMRPMLSNKGTRIKVYGPELPIGYSFHRGE